MNDMSGIAVYYGIVAYLTCWWIDLTVVIVRGPIFIDPILKWVVVLVCLVIILRGGFNHGWAWH
jgi:hypothetical protein